MEIPLSVPHLAGTELDAIARAIRTNWIAPTGPEVRAFEEEFAAAVGVPYALATSCGTAALHLGLRVLGVGQGADVLVSTLTFCASVNPILYQGGRPVLVDSERRSWNIDPALVADELDRRGRAGRLPAAIVVVHLFGQPADMEPLLAACRRWEVPILEDAAEALGTTLGGTGKSGRMAGTLGDVGAFSFDGSKMITTSIGGMLVSHSARLIEHARKLASQAREPVVHYEHTEIGFNYRMSNLLAAFGREQLRVLPARVEARRQVFEWYRSRLGELPGLSLQSEAPWGRHSRWLTVAQFDPQRTGADPETIGNQLRQQSIETRPVWKPMHQQPVYRDLDIPVLGGAVADELFERGLCLPSSSSLTEADVERVCAAISAECSNV